MKVEFDHQAVTTDLDLSDIMHSLQRGQNRYFILQLPELRCRQLRKAGIVKCGSDSHICNYFVQGVASVNLPYTTTQLPVNLERHKRPTFLLQAGVR